MAQRPDVPATPPQPQPSSNATPAPMQEHSIVKSAPPKTLRDMLDNIKVKERFAAMLGKKAAGFTSSILSLYNANAQLRRADPQSILNSAAIAASMDLPINPNLGFAYIVPYGTDAQFQMGWKGFVQLAQRTGQYKTIHATEIYEGELISYDRLSGTTVIDEAKRTSDKIVGYIAYIKLISGFEKSLWMTTEQVQRHAQRYSKSYSKPGTPWQTQFDAMALKTVIKLLLSKWGPLSIDTRAMQQAVVIDQGVPLDMEGKQFTFPDNPDTPEGEVVDMDGGELKEEAPIPKTPAGPTTQVKASDLFAEPKK